MKFKLILLILLFSLSLLLPLYVTADVKTYDVQELRYHNHGGYYAQVKLRWRDTATGKTMQTGSENNTPPGGIHIVDIDTLKSAPKPGEEVWLRINIQLGDKRSCRKDGTKFYYKSGNNERAIFSSAGTTHNDNHCKIKCATNCSDQE